MNCFFSPVYGFLRFSSSVMSCMLQPSSSRNCDDAICIMDFGVCLYPSRMIRRGHRCSRSISDGRWRERESPRGLHVCRLWRHGMTFTWSTATYATRDVCAVEWVFLLWRDVEMMRWRSLQWRSLKDHFNVPRCTSGDVTRGVCRYGFVGVSGCRHSCGCMRRLDHGALRDWFQIFTDKLSINQLAKKTSMMIRRNKYYMYNPSSRRRLFEHYNY